MLLRSGGFYEANPLMRPVMGEPLAGLIFKCLLPAVLLIAVSLMTRSLEIKGMRRVDRVISLVLVLYSALCSVHIVNLIFLAN